jgi:EAL domain-containing protein (putative c-di-GMP-specific phosphodiesterase class I)/DNA-binding response OmpR family regulator
VKATDLPRVLCVDDEIRVLEGLTLHLRRDYQVFTANSGEAALQVLEEIGGAAVIVSDMRMPGMDGAALLSRVKQLYPATTRILLTGEPGREVAETAINQAQVFRFLTKPCSAPQLKAAVEAGVLQYQFCLQADEIKSRVATLEQLVNERTRDLQLTNAQLETAQQELTQVKSRQSTRVRTPLALERALHDALKAGQLTVHYQPLVDIKTRRAVSLEALVRWQHPELGEIPPSRFIPVAEESGLILPLGEWMLRSVCTQLVSWQCEQVPIVPVAVNLSAVQLQRTNIWRLVRQVLRETGLSAEWLALELTESALIADTKNAITYLQGLRRDGVRVQIDDFGTGYSSLSYLKHLPIDTIKIDRSFISELGTNPTDEIIVKAILVMAHSLGIRVVAEGVETAAQLAVLLEHGCEVAQGYYFSRPMPADRCRQLLLDLGQRPTFTETLRIHLTSNQVTVR